MCFSSQRVCLASMAETVQGISYGLDKRALSDHEMLTASVDGGVATEQQHWKDQRKNKFHIDSSIPANQKL